MPLSWELELGLLHMKALQLPQVLLFFMLKSNIACILLWQHGQYAVETEITDAHPVSYDNNVGNKT